MVDTYTIPRSIVGLLTDFQQMNIPYYYSNTRHNYINFKIDFTKDFITIGRVGNYHFVIIDGLKRLKYLSAYVRSFPGCDNLQIFLDEYNSSMEMNLPEELKELLETYIPVTYIRDTSDDYMKTFKDLHFSLNME